MLVWPLLERLEVHLSLERELLAPCGVLHLVLFRLKLQFGLDGLMHGLGVLRSELGVLTIV